MLDVCLQLIKSTKAHHILRPTIGDDTFDSSIVLARPALPRVGNRGGQPLACFPQLRGLQLQHPRGNQACTCRHRVPGSSMCESRCATPFAATGHPLQIRVGGIPLTLSLGFGFLPRAEGVKCGMLRRLGPRCTQTEPPCLSGTWRWPWLTQSPYGRLKDVETVAWRLVKWAQK